MRGSPNPRTVNSLTNRRSTRSTKRLLEDGPESSPATDSSPDTLSVTCVIRPTPHTNESRGDFGFLNNSNGSVRCRSLGGIQGMWA